MACCSGAYLETDFASFIAWRDWGFPDTSRAQLLSPSAALRSADGAFLLGVMGAHTATAGQIYFPAGTPDPNDIDGDTVDLERGVIRELIEETGLGSADVVAGAGMVGDAARPAPRADENRAGRASTAAALRDRILRIPGKPEAAGAHGHPYRARSRRSAPRHAALCGGLSDEPPALRGLPRPHARRELAP